MKNEPMKPQIDLSDYYPSEDRKLFNEFPRYSKEVWIEEIYKTLEKFNKPKDLDSISWKTYDGLNILPFYTKEDLQSIEWIYEYPFIKKNQSSQSWEIIQYIQGKQDEILQKLEQTTRRGADGVILPIGSNGYPYIFYGTGISDFEFLKKTFKNYQFSFYLFGGSLELLNFLKQIELNKEKVSILLDPFLDIIIEERYNEEYKKIIKTIQEINPIFPCIAIRGDLYQQMGLPTALELALTISQFAEILYLLDQEKRLEFLSKMTIVQSVGSLYFLEIAKLRATRRLISMIVSGFDIEEISAPKQFIVTSNWNHSIYDLYNNLLRNTISTMAGILGGADSIVVLPINSVNQQDDEFTRRLAINTQLIAKYESHMDFVVDPLGGSYYVETITDMIIKKAWEIFLEIEDQGGFLQAFRNGYISDRIAQKQQEIIKNIKSRKEFLLGVNQYPKPDDFLLNEYKEFKLIGTYDPKRKIQFFRAATFFEELRLKTEKLSKEKGIPVVQLIPFGKLAQQRARASFILNFFTVAGFIVNDPGDLKNKETIIQFLKEISYKESLIKCYVLCSSDDEYLPMFLEIKEELQKLKKPILIAGLPKESEELKNLGIFDFIHIKSNFYETLLKYQKLFLEI